MDSSYKRECNHIITTRIDALYTNSTIIQEIKTDLFDQSFCFIQDWIYKWYCFSLSNFFSIINQTFFFTKNEDIEISTQGQIVLEMDLLLWKNNYNQSWGLSLTPHPLRKYINFKVAAALFFSCQKDIESKFSDHDKLSLCEVRTTNVSPKERYRLNTNLHFSFQWPWMWLNDHCHCTLDHGSS